MGRGRAGAGRGRMRARRGGRCGARNRGRNVTARALRLGGRAAPELARAARGRAPPAGLPPGRCAGGDDPERPHHGLPAERGPPPDRIPGRRDAAAARHRPGDEGPDPRPEAGLPPGRDRSGCEPLMARAAIVVVDEEAADLARLGRELRKRYGQDYEIIEASSGSETLEALKTLQRTERPVAVVLAAHWMKPMTGIELLGRVRELHPMARRGLLVSWGDRSCNGPLLEAMSLGSVDYFVLKPRVEPDEEFHQAIGAFLADWARLQGIGFK